MSKRKYYIDGKYNYIFWTELNSDKCYVRTDPLYRRYYRIEVDESYWDGQLNGDNNYIEVSATRARKHAGIPPGVRINYNKPSYQTFKV